MAIKIFIDQGYNPTGYHNTGARGLELIEEDITYQVGIYLANLLGADSRFTVMLSKPTPTTVLGTTNATSLAERVRMANEWPADYFISIHANANVNPAINGVEIYIYQYNTQAHWLAQHILDAIVQFTDLNYLVRQPFFTLIYYLYSELILLNHLYLCRNSIIQCIASILLY